MTIKEMTDNQYIMCEDCIEAVRDHNGYGSVIIIDRFDGEDFDPEMATPNDDPDILNDMANNPYITVGRCSWCEELMEDSVLYVCEFR